MRKETICKKKKKKGFVELSIEFGDFLIFKKILHCICFLCFSIWVVCFIGYLWAARPSILWKVVVLVVLCLVIISFYHHLCFHLFPKWEPGSKCWVYLETHYLLNSIIFIFFPFEWHTLGIKKWYVSTN